MNKEERLVLARELASALKAHYDIGILSGTWNWDIRWASATEEELAIFLQDYIPVTETDNPPNG